MAGLKFEGKVIPVARLLPDDVLVFSIRSPMPEDELVRTRQRLRDQFPEPRKILVMDSGVGLAVGRDGEPVFLGES